MHRSGIVCVGFVLLVAAATRGEAQTSTPAAPAARAARAAAVAPPRVTTGSVAGTAWRGDSTRYPQARIRLRNVQTGRGVARTIADGEGRFHFEQVDPGPYVVELLSADDEVLAVGDLFGIAPGTSAVTFVRLSAKAPWFSGFFGNAAAAAIAAASTLGVTATGSNGQPVSAQ
jgi:hypothetical protein